MKTAVLTAAILAVSTAVTAQHRQRDIVDTAIQAGSFKTLTKALQAADLVGALRGKGPFTVFAPTDAAFAKLPRRALASLLEEKNRDQLTAILTYHVIPGRVAAAEVIAKRGAATLNGQRVAFRADDGGVRVGGARVSKTDIRCRNGIIHVLDSVMMPAGENLVELAAAAGKFKTLLAAAKAAGLAGALSGDGPFTVFAPTDAAFVELGEKTIASLLEKKNRGQLAAILKYHVVPGRLYTDTLVTRPSAKTLQGAALQVGIRDGRLRVNDSNVTMNDLDASNGVVHVIDKVLTPPQPQGRKVIGVFTERVSSALAAQLGIERRGALLITNLSGDNAKNAGVERYDVVTHINDRPATSANLDRGKEEAGFGGALELTILRRGEKRTVTVPVVAGKH